MLGLRRPADRQLVGKLADSPRPLGQAFDDAASGGITQGLPSVASLVSVHER